MLVVLRSFLGFTGGFDCPCEDVTFQTYLLSCPGVRSREFSQEIP